MLLRFAKNVLRIRARITRTLIALATSSTVLAYAFIAPCSAADDILTRVRAHKVLHCAGIVRPGIAVPTLDGKHWYGIAPDMCRAVAAAVLGSSARMTFRPLDLQNPRQPPITLDDIVFISGSELLTDAALGAMSLDLGPAIVHDALALLVRAAGVSNIADLSGKQVCVEPGSPADRALIRYFAQHTLTLHEHPFQETDEMRQAYGAGNCDALAGPRSTLASVRADPAEGRRTDRLLPQTLGDDPIFAATTGDARWSRILWWTFSVLVDAEKAGIGADVQDPNVAIPGVPPAIGRDLSLSPQWMHDVLAAGGNYGELFDRSLGAGSRFRLARGQNALDSDGGLIFGLSVE